MSQNRSSAVMQQRGKSKRSLDYYPTPMWATRALCERLAALGWLRPDMTAWEPACGEGHMARPLREAFASVRATDVHPYGFGEVEDFLMPFPIADCPNWIVTNPPFTLAADFLLKAVSIATDGVAILVRSAFLEGAERHRSLFQPYPPSLVLQFVERVPMVEGRVDSGASSATAYCWIVWHRARFRRPEDVTCFGWIAPCRKRLERSGDYDAPTVTP